MMVTVVMTTYNPTPDSPRNQYAQRCLGYLQRFLTAPGPMDLVIADDGSPEPFVPLWDREVWATKRVVTGPRVGIGGSLNRALQDVRGPWMYTTDDWLLQAPLDLETPLWLLDQGYDFVRLGPIHPNLPCRTRHEGGRWWLQLYTEDRGFVFGTRPFLAAGSLVEKVGLFDEGLDAYDTERLYNDRVLAHPSVYAAAINLLGPWDHIGEFEVGDSNPAFPFGKGPAS